MQRVYYISPILDQYQSAAIDQEETERYLSALAEGGAWEAPPLYVKNPFLLRPDFLHVEWLGTICPRTLAESRSSSIARDCDLLSCHIELEAVEYVFLRPRLVLEESDVVLDEGSPTWDPGRTRRLRASAFTHSMLFRFRKQPLDLYAAVVEPETGSSEIQDFVTFSQRYTGLTHSLVWEEGSSV